MAERGERTEEEYPFCRNINHYERTRKVGQGTFGEVFKAQCKTTGKSVALKKILMENEREGFPITALREIKILQMLNHDNVVKLYEICRKIDDRSRHRYTFYLVFEFCDHDLAGLLSNREVKFTLAEMKDLMKQLLEGLFFIHNSKVLHRDMKTANILITKKGVLKLADFGLSRPHNSNPKEPNRYTNRVVTLWYRPPELLLGERNYGPPVDVWGAGCIMAELWTRTPIMQGDVEAKQIMLISQLCGSINPDVWPGVEKLEYYGKLELPLSLARRVKDRMRGFISDQLALDLLDKLLILNPAKRITAIDALDHSFFWEDPQPIRAEGTLSKHKTSMFEFLAPPRRTQQQRPAAVATGPPTKQKPGQHYDRVF